MNTSQDNSAQNSEQNNHPKTINDLHQAFAQLAFSYGMVNHDDRNNSPIGTSLVSLEMDCEKLLLIAKAMRLQAKVGTK